MSNLLICLGLGGHHILRSYLRWTRLGTAQGAASLCALAIAREPMDSTLGFARQLLDTAAERDRNGRTTRPQWIREAGFDLPGEDVRVEALLASGSKDALHPARAFFDDATLAVPVSTGFSTLPCLIPTLWRDYGSHVDDSINKAISALDGPRANVVVTCSLTDGLASGLLVPVLDTVAGHGSGAVASVVLFRGGAWSGSAAGDEPSRRASNALGVLSTVLDRYQTARGFGLYRVVLLDSERQADRADTLAEGCWAIDRLLGDSSTQLPAEVTELIIDDFEVRQAGHQVEVTLEHAFSALDFLAVRARVENLAIDPASRRIWGSRLADFIEARWSGSVRASGSFDRGEFIRSLGASLEGLVKGARGLLAPRQSQPSLQRLLELTRTLPDGSPFSATGEAEARATAAHLLMHILGIAAQ